MFRAGLKTKILSLAICISLLGLGFLVYVVIQEEEKTILREKINASKLMAEPIMHSIYTDMLAERADMARFLIKGMKTIKGVERVALVRANGVEEAFQDTKTLKEVGAKFGRLKDTWVADHPDKLNNAAEGVQTPEFKRAVRLFGKGRERPLDYIEKTPGGNLLTYVVPIVARPGCTSCHTGKESARGILMISTSLDDMYGLLARSRGRWIILGLVTVAVMSLLLWLLVNRVVSRPIDRTVEILKAIADGKGDLTIRMDAASSDEIGLFAGWFNRFVEGLQQLVRNIFGVSDRISSASNEIVKSSQGIIKGVERQIKAVEDTSASIKEIDGSIKTVVDETGALKDFSIRVSDSADSMAEDNDAVSVNIDKLFSTGASVNSSINGMAVSINLIASHIEELFKKTEDVVSSIMDIDSRVKEVEDYAGKQAELAERVRVDAEEMGLKSVVKTREGIEKVRSEVASTSEAVNRLGERSKEIGKILTVINDFTDTTHLLALNATVLASQAGEHGNSFAVVARQIKDLAAKTTVSTKEIAELIGHVQNEADAAVESMKRSSGRVANNVRLSRESQDALVKILASARNSFTMSKMIEKATTGQTKSAGQISNAARTISSMVSEINARANEQSAAAAKILNDTLDMKEFMEGVRLSIGAQSRETRRLSEAVMDMVRKVKTVSEAASGQMAISMSIVSSIGTVRDVAENNTALVARLENTVKDMNREAENLKKAVLNFKT